MLCSLLSALPRDRGARRDPVSRCPNAWAVPPDLQGASANRVKRLGGQRLWSPHWNTTAASALQAVVPRPNASAAQNRKSKRLKSRHRQKSYAVFFFEKKKNN